MKQYHRVFQSSAGYMTKCRLYVAVHPSGTGREIGIHSGRDHKLSGDIEQAIGAFEDHVAVSRHRGVPYQFALCSAGCGNRDVMAITNRMNEIVRLDTGEVIDIAKIPVPRR